MRLATTVVAVCSSQTADAEAVHRALAVGGDRVDLQTSCTLSRFRELAAATPPDIAFISTDVGDGSALDVLADPALGRSFPVLMVVDLGDEAAATEAVAAGAVDYLVRSPAGWSDLPHTIARSRRMWQWQQRCADGPTESRSVEAALRQADLHRGAVFGSVPAAFLVLDADGVVTMAEGKGLTGMGLRPGQLVGRSAYEFFAENPRVRSAVACALAGEEVLATYQVLGMCLDTRLTPVRDGAGVVTGAVGFAVDITEHKIALETAKQSESRHRALIEAIPDVVCVLDRHWCIQLANQAAAHSFRMEMEQLLGCDFRSLFHGLESSSLFETFERVMVVGQQESVTADYTMDDGRHWYEMTVSPMPEGLLFICRDVTERRRVEQALRQAEAKYRTVVEQVPAVIYSVARRSGGRDGFISPRVEHMLGFTPDEWFGASDFWAARLHPDDRERVSAATDRLYEHGEPFNEDYRYVAKDGRSVWVHEEARAVPGIEDEALFFHGVLTDITELKLAQEALLHSQAAYELVVGSMQESLGVFDRDGNCLFANRALADFLIQGTPAAVMGRNVRDVLPPEQAESLVAYYRQTIAAGQSTEQDIQITTRHGDRWFRNTQQPIGYLAAAGTAVLSISHDITERVRAEQALREAEARWQFALEGAGDGVWDWDVRSGRVFYSRQWKEMLGYSEEEIGDGFAEWESRVHPDDRSRCTEALDRHLAGATPIYACDHRIRGKDGAYRWVLGRGKVVDRDATGRPVRAIGTQADISEGKRAEQERLEMERRLLHSQKLESLGVLAGGIAHDFNNLLAAIVGNLDLSLQELSPVSAARPGIEAAAAAAQRAADLTRQMLAYSGRGRFITQRMDLTELVEENAHMLRAAIARNVSLRLELQRNLPPIVADPGQMQQVVMNLITNASEAIGEETGVVSILTGARHCDEAYLSRTRLEDRPAAGRFVVLEVSDTGCGMSEETQQRLFDPFYTTKFAGRGLGMAAVQGILRSHNGAVVVDSEPGRGSTITVLLPALEAEDRPGAVGTGPAGAAPASVALSGTALVVDDEEFVRTLCARMVARCGLTPLTAANGQEALRTFREHADEITCVILDLTMPEMDGAMTFEALRQIRPDVKVILCSGYGEQEATRRFAGRGLAGFVHKPYRSAELRAELERVLAGGESPAQA